MASTFSTWTQSSDSNVDFKTGFLAPPPTPIKIKTNTRTARVYNGRTHRSQAYPSHGHIRTVPIPPPPIPVPIRTNNRTAHAHHGQTRNTPPAAPASTKPKKAPNPSALTTSSTSTNDTSDTAKTTTSIVSRASSAISAMTFRAVAWLSEGVRICIILYIVMFFMSLFFMVFSYVTPDRTPIGGGGMLDASNSSFTGNGNSLGSTGTNASVTGSPYDPPMNLDPTSETRHTTDFTPYDPIITTTIFIVIAVSPILSALGWMVYDAIFGGFEKTRALWVNVRAGWRWKIDGRWWRYGRLGEKADGEGDGEEGQGVGGGIKGWGRSREKGGDEESVTYSYTRDQGRDWNV